MNSTELGCARVFGRHFNVGTALPATAPLALTSEFSGDRNKATQWKAFLRKGRLIQSPPPLEEIVVLLASFLMPPTLALVANEPWNRTWVPVEWR